MSWDIIQAKQDRRKTWEVMKQINELAATENRDFTAEEKEKWDKADAELKRMTDAIARQEMLLEQRAGEAKVQDMAGFKPGQEGDPTSKDREYAKAFRMWLKDGMEGLTAEQRVLMESKYKETRQLGVGTGASGGFLVPQGFYDRLVEVLRSFTGVRQTRATILNTTTGNTIQIPTTDDTANTGQLITEGTAITDLTPSFGQRTLGAFAYTSRVIRVSLQLLQDSAIDIERYLAGVMGTRIGRITNNHFTVGTGTGQPRGVVTDATSGVVAGAGNTTTITYANLVALEHSLDPSYRTSAEWMFHDSTLRTIKQLVDGQGRPLWTPGIAVREPDTILGYRYVVNQDMATMAANARSILFGDFTKFFVRDALDVQVLRLVERYAEMLQIGFLAFSRHDCVLTDTAAVRFYQNSAT